MLEKKWWRKLELEYFEKFEELNQEEWQELNQLSFEELNQELRQKLEYFEKFQKLNQEQFQKYLQLQEESQEYLLKVKQLQLLLQLQEQLRSTESSVYAEKLPKGTSRFLNNEELQAYGIEYRQAWYGDKSPNLWTHLMVWLKTWQFILGEIICKQFISLIKQRFKPLYKPRLPKQ